jgi:hypothetical protein
MLLHFAPHLDGMQPAAPVTAAGVAALGPARMLDLLEVRLGLPPMLARPGEALLAYQACLAELDAPARFYHRSFKSDALGVARTLLAWRAAWHEHGWAGAFAAPVSRRLADMAAVETLAHDRVPLDAGQRLERVLAALDDGLVTGIDRIVLHCEQAELTPLWRTVLARLATATADEVAPRPHADPRTDLGRVQRALLGLALAEPAASSGVGRGGAAAAGGVAASGSAAAVPATAPRDRETLAGDASLVVVRGISRDLSAQAIAEHLLQTPEAYKGTVVIAERDGIIVDNALERVGLPRVGFQHYSRFRAVTQVLKLCLGLVWEPIDAQLLLQFLIHPVGPLPDHARSALAEAVASEPGVGGTEWRAALDAIAERMRTKFDASDVEIERLRHDIAYWLEGERYAPQDGAPLAALIERAQRCTSWLTAKRHALDEDDAAAALFATAEAQGQALMAALAALEAQGAGGGGGAETLLRRIPLERLVDEVAGHAADPAAFAQANHVRAATDPAAITQTWPRVIWWDLAPRQSAASYAWSEAELAELAREGVALPPVDALIRTRIRAWLRPILNAREQLILVVHERDEGHHPLWSQLKSAFTGFTETRIEDALLASTASAMIPALAVATEPLPLKPLRLAHRYWQLPSDCAIAPRPQESYSSLDKLLRYPHDYVLTYAAKLYRGRVADMTDENLLYGNLAHRLLERFFTTVPNWPHLKEPEARAWLADRLPTLIRQEGALLHAPGRGVVRERVLATLETTLIRLLKHLRSAGIEHATAEHYGEAPFKDTALRGTIDLLLRDASGRDIVLDVKWGGQAWRGSELAENRHLQLAAYAYLRYAASRDNRWPYQAYYIASTGNIVAPDTRVFPNALVYAPPAGETTAALWKRVGAAYEWRRAQLAAGRVEVVAADTEPQDALAPPADVFDCSATPSMFDKFTWLTGWEDGI